MPGRWPHSCDGYTLSPMPDRLLPCANLAVRTPETDETRSPADGGRGCRTVPSRLRMTRPSPPGHPSTPTSLICSGTVRRQVRRPTPGGHRRCVGNPLTHGLTSEANDDMWRSVERPCRVVSRRSRLQGPLPHNQPMSSTWSILIAMPIPRPPSGRRNGRRPRPSCIIDRADDMG